MPAKMQDVFVNQAYGGCTELVAGTLAFSEIQTGISLFEKVAWVVHRIMWFEEDLVRILDVDDFLVSALVCSNRLNGLSLQDPAVIDIIQIGEWIEGTPASGHLVEKPIVHDFTNLPGGGLIVPPKPLYIAHVGVSLAAATAVNARIFFTHKELAPDEYWELVESRRMVE